MILCDTDTLVEFYKGTSHIIQELRYIGQQRPVQVFAEVTLGSRPLTRAEFRKICDRCETKEEILKALTVSSQRSGSLPMFVGVALAAVLVAFLVRSIARRTMGGKGGRGW